MSHYTDDPTSVRVDFFNANGKWYTTEAIIWLDYEGEIFSTFQRSLAKSLRGRLCGLWAVCLAPYSDMAFPMMVRVPNQGGDVVKDDWR